jgi:erythronate-4-phosphate dehydrogenase
MKIIADAYIPFLRGLLDDVAQVEYLAPTHINAQAVKDADALIIRTRTHCNQALLDGSNVKFIATATIGYDHIDTQYCAQQGITWTNCPGCNANSVVNYIHAVLTTLYPTHLADKTLGIVGVGNVGSRVAKMAASLGMRVLLNDPPRALNEPNIPFKTLSELQEKCDIITFHVPLSSETHHLVNASFLQACKHNPLIINAARGEVCQTQALLNYSGDVVLDCWENEPNISIPLLNKVKIGTPHIAGYSVDGKANGTRMAAEAVCQFFGIQKTITIEVPGQKGIPYCVQAESDALKAHPELFEAFRNNYPLRRDNISY